jgi:hypothetical protein
MWTLAAALHIRTAVPTGPKFSKGERNGQEKDTEEVEEDSTDQAAVED